MELDASHMARALELAARGRGWVEPNPLVGCTIVQGEETVGEGFHERFGGPHAEVHALASAGARAKGATAFVTLEPCCHQGKTPPCTKALIAAGVRRVVVAQLDPFVQVAGQGIAELRAAGIEVDVGLLADAAQELNAPYLKLIQTGRPWIIAKWAMTLDGKLATASGDSQWISSPASRAIVHQLRGRVDAIMVGRGTAVADDPLLTARDAEANSRETNPAGLPLTPGPSHALARGEKTIARMAARIVVDSLAALPVSSQLVRTAREVPVLVAASHNAVQADCNALTALGCEVLICPGETHAARLDWLLQELGRRRMTNVLVEGGSQLLGDLFDARQIDEVHMFMAPKLAGGLNAVTPIAGTGVTTMADALSLSDPKVAIIAGDIYVQGRVKQALG